MRRSAPYLVYILGIYLLGMFVFNLIVSNNDKSGSDFNNCVVKEALNYLEDEIKVSLGSEKDCSGFVQLVYQHCGQQLPRSSQKQFEKCKTSDAFPGNLVFFGEKQSINHVGIVISDTTFIHSPGIGKKVRIDNFSTPYYKERFISYAEFIP